MKILDNNGHIALQWIPSHSGISGNEFVDNIAKQALNHPVITNFDNILSDLQRLCRKRTMKCWIDERENKLKLTFLGQIRDNVTVPFDSFTKRRNISTAIQRLRIGHTSLNAHLHRLKLINSPDCQYCGESETIKHVLLDCPRYYSRRILFRQALQKLKIQFTLSKILGKDITDRSIKVKLYRHLAVFLKSTNLIERL